MNKTGIKEGRSWLFNLKFFECASSILGMREDLCLQKLCVLQPWISWDVAEDNPTLSSSFRN